MTTVRHAHCSCGALKITATGEPHAVSVCHCLECQRRTGSVFGVGAYFSPSQLKIEGPIQNYSRPCDSGETFVSSFCPQCGTSLFWKVLEEGDSRIGVAVGAFADPSFPKPHRSVWERSHHSWVGLSPIANHFRKGQSDPTIPTPKQVLELWIEAFNSADAEKVAALYHSDAVNHQVANAPVVGAEAIREMFRREFDQAEMVCIPENLFSDGEWAILEWKDPLGLRGCGFFHVVDGKIKFQRGYWDKLSFLRAHQLQLPRD